MGDLIDVPQDGGHLHLRAGHGDDQAQPQQTISSVAQRRRQVDQGGGETGFLEETRFLGV
jgi:hypothetical protein